MCVCVCVSLFLVGEGRVFIELCVCARMFLNACGPACVYKSRGTEWGGWGASLNSNETETQWKKNRIK